MMFPALTLCAAVAAGVIHFGSHDNVRVESMGSNIRITAYGPAAHVPLLLTPHQVGACAQDLASDFAHCQFDGQGTIVLRHIGGSWQMTFADPLDANVVDIDLDEAGLRSALLDLRTFVAKSSGTRR